jgi:uncharacterized short protein YbdD (DUF466 family)
MNKFLQYLIDVQNHGSAMKAYEEEQARLKPFNDEIAYLNQLSQLNPDNQMMQNKLVEQYMGMLEDPDGDAGKYGVAMDFLSMPNPELQQAGMQMLVGLPDFASYLQPKNLQTGSWTNSGAPINAMKDVLSRQYLGLEEPQYNESATQSPTPQQPQGQSIFGQVMGNIGQTIMPHTSMPSVPMDRMREMIARKLQMGQ